MNRVAVDASFAGAWVLADEASERSEAVLSATMAGTVQLIVPALWHFEMSNLVRSAVRRRRLTRDDAFAAVAALAAIPVVTASAPDAEASRRMLHLALQFDLSSYDACYLELADRLRVPLRTLDEHLASAAARLGLE